MYIYIYILLPKYCFGNCELELPRSERNIIDMVL